MGSPLVDQFRKGGVSRDVRLTAASGLLPLKPIDQVELLFLLTRDRDGEIRRKAESGLMEVPPEDLSSVLADRSTNPKALDFYGARLDSPDLLQAVIQNQTTEDLTILELVPRLSSDLLELIVINQTRLLRHTAIIEALEAHPSLSADQRRRLSELRHDFKIGVEAEPVPVAPEVPMEREVLMDLDAGPPEDEAPPPMSIEEAMGTYGDGVEESELSEEEKKVKLSAFQRLVGMTPAEKMLEALKGNREARMLLVRDRNRVVYSAVLSSPKLTDGDVVAFAAMRNVSPEVLRQIGAKREWTKKYNIRLELVRNPLTPIEISMQQIARLSAMDLKRLTRDRNVPEQVRRQATKLVTKNQ
jgi:hypothetical protein